MIDLVCASAFLICLSRAVDAQIACGLPQVRSAWPMVVPTPTVRSSSSLQCLVLGWTTSIQVSCPSLCSVLYDACDLLSVLVVVGAMAVFGRVTKGMDVVHAIEKVRVEHKTSKPFEEIKIINIDVLME